VLFANSSVYSQFEVSKTWSSLSSILLKKVVLKVDCLFFVFVLSDSLSLDRVFSPASLSFLCPSVDFFFRFHTISS
jgi:hypothetical protein